MRANLGPPAPCLRCGAETGASIPAHRPHQAEDAARAAKVARRALDDARAAYLAARDSHASAARDYDVALDAYVAALAAAKAAGALTTNADHEEGTP